MARLYPESFPPDLKADRGGRAECRVFEALADALSDDWVVIHRVRWLDAPGQKSPRDGECDFLIAHPERGMLVLEVKGGRIGFDPKTARWTSTDHQGAAHDIRNPFEQAISSHHSLKRKIESLPYWKNRGVPLGHAVALPDCAKSSFPGPEASEHITLDAADLTRASEAVERAFGFWRLSPGEDWKRHGIAVIERLFVYRDFGRVPLGVELRRHETEFVRLTAEQARALDLLRHHRRAAISGCAGSGKTMLAIEKARRLASEGFRVLVTCFNRALAEFIRSQLPPPEPAKRARAVSSGPGQLDLFSGARVDVQHFHALAGSWARRAGITLPEPADLENERDLYDAALPEALQQATGKLPERYDAVVVDEGQDFQEDWWVPLQSLLGDPDRGVLYVFYDDNQSLYTGGARLPITTPPFALSLNCRNTRAIHSWVLRFYRGDRTPQVSGPEGRAPVVHRYRDDRELREHLRRALHQLVHEEKVPERDIVVLTPLGQQLSALWKDPRYGNLTLTDGWPPAPGYVQCATVHAFKGLERAVVVLAEVTGRARGRREELAYVGGSRAMSHLVVIEEG